MSWHLPAFYMAKCDGCNNNADRVRLTKTTEGSRWLCSNCRDFGFTVGAFKVKRQPVAFVTDERGVEHAVDGKGIIPPHENPYSGDDHFGWKHTGKVPRKKTHIL